MRINTIDLPTGLYADHVESVDACIKKWVKIGKEFEPDMKKHRQYQAKYEQWLALYDSIEKFKIIH